MSNNIETAVVVRESSAVGQALGVNEILAQVRLIQDVMSKVMTDGEHYGVIPGTGTKKTLLQPGAQKLTMTFRLAPEYALQETNLQNGHKEYRVICTLKSIQTGNFVGQGVGCCSTMESKYRYRSGSRKCPLCGAEAIIKGKAEYGGGWLCFAKKGGCGAKWDDKEEAAKAIAAQMTEKMECDNPADFYNTVLKMAKKRAFVDATITATAASDIFTQDVGDDEPNGDAPPAPGVPVSSPPKPKTVSPPPKTQPVASQPKRTPKEEQDHTKRLETWLEQCKTSLLQKLMPVTAGAEEYARKSGMILPNEVLPDVSLNKLFPSVVWSWSVEQNKAGVKKDFDALTAAVQSFMDGDVLPDEDDLPMGEEAPGQNKPIEVPPADEWFWDLIVPVPRKGQKRDEYLKSPDTIRSLYEQRHGTDEDAQLARERLYGFVHHYQPKGWVKKDGTQMPASDADKKFRDALDAFSIFLESQPKEEQL